MKKSRIVFLFMMFILFATGCGKDNEDSIVKKLNNNLKEIDGYKLSGDLTIYNSNNQYSYDVEVFYKKEEKYRVNLLNTSNNHEQIILKNDKEVYVVTPSLNKSFKFQSNWPNDSSQVYLISSLYNDIYNCKERVFEVIDDGYRFKVDANYPNNNNLVKQIIVFDKDLNLKTVDIYNENDELQMSMVFNGIEINELIDDNVFDLESIISGTNVTKDENVTSIDDIIYPLYIPSGTVLTDEEKVSKGDGERVILTFEGEKPFILVEETLSVEDDFSVVPMYGEPYLLFDTIASLSNNSISWINDGIEYYLVSDVMSQIELIEIANSITIIDGNK